MQAYALLKMINHFGTRILGSGWSSLAPFPELRMGSQIKAVYDLHRDSLAIKTKNREELIDITAQIRAYIRSKKIKRGCVVVFVPHTTAGITINEGADPTVKEDLLYALRKLIPYRDSAYKHLEGNSDAHIKASLLGSSLNLPIDEGDLLLGTWQAIFFAEFDGPRQRRVYLSLPGNI